MIFETLDTMIAIGVIFLILSMVHKYLMSIVKRFLKIKAKVVANEMKIFIGENTTKFLIPYLKNKEKHLNLLEDIKKGEMGLRLMNKEQLQKVVAKLDKFLDDKNSFSVIESFGVDIDRKAIKSKVTEVRKYIKTFNKKVEGMYDNTMENISKLYESNMRKYTLYFGLGLAVIINADFFDIYKSISKNKIVKDSLVLKAELIDRHWEEIFSKQINTEENADNVEALKNTSNLINNLMYNISDAGLHLGWSEQDINNLKNKSHNSFLAILMKIVGLCISGLLISFGAPFWHDFLSAFTGIKNKFLSIKNVNGVKHQVTPKNSSKTKAKRK